MEYFVISAKFVPLKYYTLSSQLRRLTSFSVGLFGSANSVTRSYPVMRKSCIRLFLLQKSILWQESNIFQGQCSRFVMIISLLLLLFWKHRNYFNSIYLPTYVLTCHSSFCAWCIYMTCLWQKDDINAGEVYIGQNFWSQLFVLFLSKIEHTHYKKRKF